MPPTAFHNQCDFLPRPFKMLLSALQFLPLDRLNIIETRIPALHSFDEPLFVAFMSRIFNSSNSPLFVRLILLILLFLLRNMISES